MSDSPIIEDAVSIFPVIDIETTVDFYADVLGFERRMISDDKTFAIVVHGQAAIHFTKTNDEQALRATANNISIYLWVRQIDKLFEQLKPKLDLLPKDRVSPPFTQPYGMREFHVKDPDGCLLLFGENI
jgi:catechol 2,3-dioxygenase-like lactoylglutathione lyase family enzyme